MAIKTVTNKNFNGEFNILIKHKITNGEEIITPIVEDGVKWETSRQGSPGKLTFKVYKDKNSGLNIQEGDAVLLRYRNQGEDWKAVFNGYIFSKKHSKSGWIDVTAYDLLRYFKNKATYVYTDLKASNLVKMIAEDYKLPIGTIHKTNYVIGERVEDNQCLFDIIQNALDQTLMSTTSMYILYADQGKVQLRDALTMKLGVIINQDTAEDFDYESSIDKETYNEIELYYDNDETNKREYYHAISKKNVGNWGRLRLTESIKNPTNAADRVEKMLKLYNRKTRSLKVKGAFGDVRCRAGASVIVQLDLDDIKISNYMLIEKATHTFKANEYRMDLTLSDSEFIA